MCRFLTAIVLLACLAGLAAQNDGSGDSGTAFRTQNERLEQAGERLERAGERASDRFEQFSDRIGERADRFGDQVDQFGDRVGERFDRLGERFDRVGERFDRFGRRVDQFGNRVDRFGNRMGQRFERFGQGGHRGIHLRIGRDYSLAEGASSNEPIVVIGADATIDGKADDNVVVIGGRLKVGPKAVIRGDVMTFGDKPEIDPAAEIRGEIDDATTGVLADLRAMWPRISVGLPRQMGRGWAFAAMSFTVVRLALVLVMALLLTLVAPRWIGGMAGRVSRSPGRSLFVGVASEVLVLPAFVIGTIILIVSIIGIPLVAAMPFFVGGFALLWTAGFAAAAGRVGLGLRGRQGADTVSIVDVFVGFTVLTAFTVAGHLVSLMAPVAMGPAALTLGGIGLFVEYAAWTIGLGAAMAGVVSRRRRITPPPLRPQPVTA